MHRCSETAFFLCLAMENEDGLLLNLAGTEVTDVHAKVQKPRSNPWMRKQERREKALVRNAHTMFSTSAYIGTQMSKETLCIPQEARKKQRRDSQSKPKDHPPKRPVSALKGYSLDAAPGEDAPDEREGGRQSHDAHDVPIPAEMPTRPWHPAGQTLGASGSSPPADRHGQLLCYGLLCRTCFHRLVG